MSGLADGTYDVFVVDATAAPADGGGGGGGGDDVVHLELTVLAGGHKGEVVGVTATGLGVDEIDLIGLPGTLVVESGAPSFRLDD